MGKLIIFGYKIRGAIVFHKGWKPIRLQLRIESIAYTYIYFIDGIVGIFFGEKPTKIEGDMLLLLDMILEARKWYANDNDFGLFW